jgi:putative serine protease PepD
MNDDARDPSPATSTSPRRRPSRLRVGMALAAVGIALVGGAGTAVAITEAIPSVQPALVPVPARAANAAPATPAVAEALQAEYAAAIATVSPSVVVIQTPSGLGSGVIFDARGDIVTNAHVVDGSRTFQVTLANGTELKGSLVGTFTGDDLAVIKVDGTGLHSATFADSSRLAVGDIVLAVGNPLGLQSSVTQGIVSAVGRTVSEPNGAALPGAIQTSADINPGNSGGALVDINGDVVGIPTLAAVDEQIGGSAPGIGFAISSNTATDIAGQLIVNGKVVNSHRAYLGVHVADASGAPGPVVVSVQAGSPAAIAGLVKGEAITSVDGTTTATSDDLTTMLAGLTPGQSVTVATVRSSGARATVTVVLGELPG